MPIVKVTTNVNPSSIKADLTKKLSAAAARVTEKPESYVAVFILPVAHGSFGGSSEPCAYVELESIGGFPGDKDEIARAVGNIITAELGVKLERFYVKFITASADEIAFKGHTFG